MRRLLLYALFLAVTFQSAPALPQMAGVPQCVHDIKHKASSTDLSKSSQSQQQKMVCQFTKELIDCVDNAKMSAEVRKSFAAELSNAKKEYHEKCAACMGPTLAAWMMLLPLASILKHNLSLF